MSPDKNLGAYTSVVGQGCKDTLQDMERRSTSIRSIKLFAMLTMVGVLVVVGFVPVSAQDSSSDAQTVCEDLDTDAKIELLAKLIVDDQVDEDVRNCYDTLTIEEKAQLFEAVAEERGISVEELRQEADEDAAQREDVSDTPLPGEDATARGIDWRQLIERIPFSAIFKPLVPGARSWQDSICDGDPTDVDYFVSFDFPANVSNPNSVRSFTYDVGVDLMLGWYQVRYGGIDGRGNTGSKIVRVCLGDTGVATAGGIDRVRDNLYLHP